jgi:hypothetical protein
MAADTRAASDARGSFMIPASVRTLLLLWMSFSSRLEGLLPDLEYDTCVITGDYRAATFGPFDDALEGINEYNCAPPGHAWHSSDRAGKPRLI